MRPYSQDLRERIVQALQAQEDAQAEIAERLAGSRSFIEKVWRRRRTTGYCAALPHAGGRQRSWPEAEAVLWREGAQQPDRTRAELWERVVQAGGARVSAKTRCLELQRLRLPRKEVPPCGGARHTPGKAIREGLSAAEGTGRRQAAEVHS
jgi:transposase